MYLGVYVLFFIFYFLVFEMQQRKLVNFGLFVLGGFGLYRGLMFVSELLVFKNQAKFSIGLPKNIHTADKKLYFTLPLLIENPSRFSCSINFPVVQLKFDGNVIGNTLNKSSERITILPEQTTTIFAEIEIDPMANIPVIMSLVDGIFSFDGLNGSGKLKNWLKSQVDNFKEKLDVVVPRIQNNLNKILNRCDVDLSIRVLGFNIMKTIKLSA